jgi:hypothetical protein
LKAARLIHVNINVNTPKGQIVFDLLMLVLLAVAFAGAVGYVRACDDLTLTGNAGANKSP